MLAHNEIKAIMAKKFKAENSMFTEEDIKITDVGGHIEIQIKDYEHVLFKVFPEKHDCDFMVKYGVATYEYMPFSKDPDASECVSYYGSDKAYPLKEAFVHLAYYISITF